MTRPALWSILLAGPLIWFLSFGANFALAPWACTLHWKPALYVVSVIALILTTLCAWRANSERLHPGAESTQALALGAAALNAIFFLVILAQTIAETPLGACS